MMSALYLDFNLKIYYWHRTQLLFIRDFFLPSNFTKVVPQALASLKWRWVCVQEITLMLIVVKVNTHTHTQQILYAH